MSTLPTTKIEQYGKIAAIIAYVCALIAGFGSTIGFHAMTQSWLIAVLAGIGIATVIGLGNHIIIGMARENRTRQGIAAVVAAGMLVASVAAATSSWALATAIAGQTGQRIHLLDATQAKDDALNVAHARINVQSRMPEAVNIAATRYKGAAQEEERGQRGPPGCGPKCRAYKETAENYETLSTGFSDIVDGHYRGLSNARNTLDELRRNAMTIDTAAFSENAASLSSALSAVKMLDLHPSVTNIGVVPHQAADLHKIDRDLRQVTKQISEDSPEVVVPVYRPITNAEAVYHYWDRVFGAWAAAIGIDFAPFIFIVLLLMTAREPLLRAPGPSSPTPNERHAAILEQEERLRQGHSNENDPVAEPGTKAEPQTKAKPSGPSA